MLVPMDIMEGVTIMRVVNKHFVKSIENTIKSMVYPDDVKEINYVVTVLDEEWGEIDCFQTICACLKGKTWIIK